MNETNKFIVGNNQNLNFCLHRIKLSCALIYEKNNYNFTTIRPNIKEYGIIFTPSELVDISIPKFDHIHSSITDESHYDEITYKNIDTIKCNTLSIKGIILDLYFMLFIHTDYKPWTNAKYNKRITRIIVFIIIYLFDIGLSKENINSDEMKDYLINIFTNFDIDTDINVPGMILEEHREIFEKIDDARLVIKTFNDASGDNKQIVELYKQKVLSILPLFKSKEDFINRYNNIDMMNKYLKYKRKYLELKKQLSK